MGFDIERHVYGEHRYPAQLVLQDVRMLHGSQFRGAALIVASPPCTEFSYMAMPWTRAKQIAKALRGEGDFVVARCVLGKGGRVVRSEKTLRRNARGAAHLARLLRGQGDIALAAFYESVAADIRRILSEQGDANG